MPTSYKVTAQRSGNWWALEAPGVRGAFSQVRRLDQAQEAMVDAISGVLGADPSDVDVEVRAVLPEHEALLREVEEARCGAEAAKSRASAATREAIAELSAAGLPQRDIGTLLHVSHQRVQQLAAGAATVAEIRANRQRAQRGRAPVLQMKADGRR